MGVPLSESRPETKLKTVALAQLCWLPDTSLFRKPRVALVSRYRLRAPAEGTINKIIP